MPEILAPPDVDAVLDGLKDFQRRTVEYVFRRLYLDPDATKRFLIADEVGLGKTMIARGVVAKAVEHLWERRERIDVVYVCSNGDIARQNANRLTLPGTRARVVPSRITLMPKTVTTLDRKLNFISITPGTSFNLRSSGGTVEERALMYRFLEEPWELRGVAPGKVLAGFASFANFPWYLEQARQSQVDEQLGNAFVRAASADAALRAGFTELCDEMRYLRRNKGLPLALTRRREGVIGDLRRHMARVCLDALEPDVVILDEFQRFKHLISPAPLDDPGLDEMRELAQQFMDYPDASVLLLSATPYKMYTMADDSVDDDHYDDLKRTLGFLLDDAGQTAEVVRGLAEYGRRVMAVPRDGIDGMQKLRRRLERQLLRVMVRTERLAVTKDRDGMLGPAACDHLRLEPADLGDYVALQRIAEDLRQPDMLEYWKSAPYLLNFMEGYKVKERFEEACGDPASCGSLAEAMARQPRMLLDWESFARYGVLDPANARLRSLTETLLDDPLWQLLWVPPSLPYYRLAGPFAAASERGFTKRLVFSSWKVVPKAIAAMMSYQAERLGVRSFEDEPENSSEARKRRSPLLRFARSKGRLTGMPVLALLYPSSTLVEAVDPLVVGMGRAVEEILADVEAEMGTYLDLLPRGADDAAPVDDNWYWAAPVLLDLMSRPEQARAWLLDERRLQSWGADPEGGDWQPGGAGLAAETALGEEDDSPSGRAFAEHAARMQELAQGKLTLGRRPADLPQVLARLAVAGPGVVAMRSLARICGGADALDDADVRTAAARIAWAFRNLFNAPEPMAVVRGVEERRDGSVPYWRQVLRYSTKGCLQAVLDEYLHIVRESQGLVDEEPHEIAEAAAGVLTEALSLRTVSLRTDSPRIGGDARVEIERRRMRAHYALRFGDEHAETGETLTRTASVREAFNSPFWPFVVATTSMGQEGLDFHCYCHAVVHWNLPSNPVDLEQREGRVHRYKGHAVRKNVALRYGLEGALAGGPEEEGLFDPWDRLFARARADRDPDATDLVPFWVYPVDGGARIERYVPALPLSRDAARLEALLRSLVIYRAAIGQPRQQDLVDYLLSHLPPDEIGSVVEALRIDLTPPNADA